MTKSKKCFNKIQEIIAIIQDERIKIWEKQLEKELTYAFLFNNVFSVETNKQGKYELIDLNGLHDINGYQFIGDFLNTFTGEPGWNEEYGFKTYYVDMKQQWLEELLLEIDEQLSRDNISLEDLKSEEEEKFKDLLVTVTEDFWQYWIQKEFKPIIDTYYKEVWKVEKETSMSVDMEMQKTEQRFALFQPLVEDWLKTAKLSEVSSLRPKQTNLLKTLNAWALNKSYFDLELFDEFYPKADSLKNFNWLDKSIYEQKLQSHTNIVGSVAQIWENEGFSLQSQWMTSNIKRLYKLREDIFSLSGEKIIFIHTSEDTQQFYLDEYNRINGQAQGIAEFVNVLEHSLEDLGSIIIRQVSKEYYTIKKGRKTTSLPYFNIYGVMLFKGMYRGLNATEMHEVFTTNHETGEYMGEEEGTRFFDWNIGNWKD